MLENYWTLLKNMHCSDCTLSWHLQSILIFISIIFFSYFVNIYNYLLLIQIHKCSDNFTGKNKNPSINEDLCINWSHGKFHLSSTSFFFGQKNVGGKIQKVLKKVFFCCLTWHVVLSVTPQTILWIPSTQTFSSIFFEKIKSGNAVVLF